MTEFDQLKRKIRMYWCWLDPLMKFNVVCILLSLAVTGINIVIILLKKTGLL